REDEAVAPDSWVEFDHETLMARGVPVGRHRRDSRRDLRLAVGQTPIDVRIVEVHSHNRIAFRLRVVGQSVLQLPALGMYWDLAREQLQSPRVVVVQMTDRYGVDRVEVHSHLGQ